MSKEKEDKFIVINKKRFDEVLQEALSRKPYDPYALKYAQDTIKYLQDALFSFEEFYELYLKKTMNQKYIVCNQDEPYAEKIWDIILNMSEAIEKYKKQIVSFLEKNGWVLQYPTKEDYLDFWKENNIGIEIHDNEIILIGEKGDFAHFEINETSLYSLLGYLFHNRYIGIDYRF